jgi:uncharacterized protein
MSTASLDEFSAAALIRTILDGYVLPPFGTHGISHWARVLENGLRLAEITGANKKIVRLFALLHDSKRINESIDPGHGKRGADFAESLRGDQVHLPDAEFELLYTACEFHTDGKQDGDITVQTCWDADRLDLGRVRIWPDPVFLCTEAARDPEMIAWANQRSKRVVTPKFVHQEWLSNEGNMDDPRMSG